MNEENKVSSYNQPNAVVVEPGKPAQPFTAAPTDASSAQNTAAQPGMQTTAGALNQGGAPNPAGATKPAGAQTPAGAPNQKAPNQPIKPKKKKKKTALIVVGIVLGVLVLLIGGCVYVINKGMKALQNLDSPTVEEVESQKLMDYISVSGKVESQNKVNITTTLTGTTIKELNVNIGDFVKEGDVLCEFEDEDLLAQHESVLKQIRGTDAYSAYLARKRQKNLNEAKQDRNDAVSEAQKALDEARAKRDEAYADYNALNDEYTSDLDEMAELTARQKELQDIIDGQKAAGNPAENPENTNPENTNPENTDPANPENPDTPALSPEEELAKVNESIKSLGDIIKEEAKSLTAMKAELSVYDDAVTAAETAYKTAAKNGDDLVETAKDVIEEAKYQVEDNTLIKQLEELDRKLEECKVTAPMDGIITSLNVAEGSMAGTDVLMTIQDNKNLKVTVSINESDILKVEEGQKTVIKTTATGDQEFTGKVSKVVKVMSVDAMGQNAGYSAEILIEDKDTDLLIGMTATGKVVLSEKEDVLAVPYDAIMTDEEDQKYIYIAESAGQESVYIPKKQYVSTGMETSYYVEITDGVKEGDTVVTTPAKVAEGQAFTTFDFSSIYTTTESE
ncbi:MAG: efflux RND transporter periplasmic adaptor subunit [Eubacterium sp.]|nr:efflux RND transporter periplasmic adaptor subunit [Eubacterium sp.]